MNCFQKFSIFQIVYETDKVEATSMLNQ